MDDQPPPKRVKLRNEALDSQDSGKYRKSYEKWKTQMPWKVLKIKKSFEKNEMIVVRWINGNDRASNFLNKWHLISNFIAYKSKRKKCLYKLRDWKQWFNNNFQ